MLFLFTSLLLFWLHLSTADETYVTCLSCPDVSSPSACQQTATCGKGEICYTKEYTDHRGLPGFRLGCEDLARCNLYLSAKLLVGKRDVAPAPSDKCYDCCTGDQCNGRLCQGGGGSHVSSGIHTTAHVTTSGCPAAACPEHFIPHKNSCYMFAAWSLNFTDARMYCKSRGADLVSINSQDEQEYLVKELNLLGSAVKDTVFFITGGSYSPSLQGWEWVDRSPVQYAHWHSGEPLPQTNSPDYHIMLANPSLQSSDKSGLWDVFSAQSLPFICEKSV